MKSLRIATILFAVAGLSSFAGAADNAPDSVKDSTVFVDHGGLTPSNFFYWLRDDGTAVHLARDNRTSSNASFSPPLEYQGNPQNSIGRIPFNLGTYTYTKVSASQGDLTVSENGQQGIPLPLHFDTPTSGYLYIDAMTFGKRANSSAQRNVSNRAKVSAQDAAITGFIVEKGQWALVRVLGPALKPFGVPNFAPSPRMQVFWGSLLLAEGAGWTNDPPKHEAISALVGAFPLERGSADCVYFRYFAPGAYTVVASPVAGTAAGEILTEIYYLPLP